MICLIPDRSGEQIQNIYLMMDPAKMSRITVHPETPRS